METVNIFYACIYTFFLERGVNSIVFDLVVFFSCMNILTRL